MGNAIGAKRKCAKVMKIDGSTFKVKPPSQAGAVLQHHPGFTLLDADDVKRNGVRAKPLAEAAPIERGKLYFLVELPRQPSGRVPRRAWSGQLVGGAKDRLEMLRLARRSASDVGGGGGASPAPSEEAALRVRMRLPRAEVEKAVKDSKDSSEAAKRIVELCGGSPMMTPTMTSARTAMTPPPRFVTENEAAYVPRMMTPPPSFSAFKAGRTEKRARFVALPDEIIA